MHVSGVHISLIWGPVMLIWGGAQARSDICMSARFPLISICIVSVPLPAFRSALWHDLQVSGGVPFDFRSFLCKILVSLF